MAAFCHFYGYTPTQYRALSLKDFGEMSEYMADYIKKAKANSGK